LAKIASTVKVISDLEQRISGEDILFQAEINGGDPQPLIVPKGDKNNANKIAVNKSIAYTIVVVIFEKKMMKR
jgi:hypothetical protein